MVQDSQQSSKYCLYLSKKELMPSYMTATKPTRDIIAENRSQSLSSKNTLTSYKDNSKILLQNKIIQLERQLQEYDFERQANIVYNRQFRQLGRLLGDESMQYEELKGKIQDMILQGPVIAKVGQFSQSQVVMKDNVMMSDSMTENNNKEVQKRMSILQFQQELAQLKQDLVIQRTMKETIKQQLRGYQQLQVKLRNQTVQLRAQLQSTRYQLQQKAYQLKQLQQRQNINKDIVNYGQSLEENESNSKINSNSNNYNNALQQQSNSDYQQLQKLYKKTVRQYELLQTKLYEYEQKINSSHHQLQRYNQLQTNYYQIDSKCNSLEKQLIESKRLEVDIKNESELLKSKLVEYEKLIGQGRVSIQEKDEIINQFNTKIHSYQSQIKNYQEAITNYESDKSNYESKISTLTQQISNFMKEISTYQNNLSTCTQQLNGKQFQIKQLQQSLASAQQHYQYLITMQSSHINRQHNITIKTLQSTLQTTRHQLDIISSKLIQNEKQLAQVTAAKFINQNQLKGKLLLLTTYKDKLEQYEENMVEERNRMGKENQKIAEESQRVKRQYEQSINKLKQKMNSLSQQLKHSKEHIVHLSQQLQQQQCNIQHMQQQLNEKSQEILLHKEQQKQITQEYQLSTTTYQRQLSAQQQKLHSTSQKLNQINQQLSVNISKLSRNQQQIGKKDVEIRQLNQQLIVSRDKINEQHQQIIKLGEYIDRLTRDVQNYQIMEKQYLQLNDIIKQSQLTIEQYKQQLLNLRQEVHLKDLQIERLKGEIDQIKGKTDNKEEQGQQGRKRETLILRKNQQEQQLTALTQKHNQLIQEHTQSNQQHNELSQRYRQLKESHNLLVNKLQQKSQQIQNYRHLLFNSNNNIKDSINQTVVNNSSKKQQKEIDIVGEQQLQSHHEVDSDKRNGKVNMVDNNYVKNQIIYDGSIQSGIINQQKQQQKQLQKEHQQPISFTQQISNNNNSNNQSQLFQQSRSSLSQQTIQKEIRTNNKILNAIKRTPNKPLSIIVSSSNLQSSSNSVRRQSQSPSSRVTISYDGRQSRVIYTSNTIVRNSSGSQEKLQLQQQQQGIISPQKTYQQDRSTLSIYSSKQIIEVNQPIKSPLSSMIEPVQQQKQKRQSIINVLSNEGLMGNKVIDERQHARMMSPIQSQIYTTRNNGNDQTITLNKTINQYTNNNSINKQSRFSITDNNLTIRPSSRSVSRQRETVSNKINNNVINNRYVFTQAKSPNKSVFPTNVMVSTTTVNPITSNLFATSTIHEQQTINDHYSNNSISHQTQSPRFNSLRQSTYSNNNAKISNNKNSINNNNQQGLKEGKQSVVSGQCCFPESYDYKKTSGLIGNSQVGKFNVVKQKKSTQSAEYQHQLNIIEQQQRQNAFTKYRPTSFGQQIPSTFQTLTQSTTQNNNNPFNHDNSMNDSEDSGIDVMQKQDEDIFNCCKG